MLVGGSFSLDLKNFLGPQYGASLRGSLEAYNLDRRLHGRLKHEIPEGNIECCNLPAVWVSFPWRFSHLGALAVIIRVLEPARENRS